MNKELFLKIKQDDAELQALTSLSFEPDDSQFMGAKETSINFHDPAHRLRIAELICKALEGHSATVLTWLKAESVARIEMAKAELLAERNELDDLIS